MYALRPQTAWGCQGEQSSPAGEASADARGKAPQGYRLRRSALLLWKEVTDVAQVEKYTLPQAKAIIAHVERTGATL